MSFKQAEERMLCSDLVTLQLQSRTGQSRKLTVNLEEIWSSGACFQTDLRIRRFARVRLVCGDCEFRGTVVARTFAREVGYYVEMRFAPSCTWSEAMYRPSHLLNPLLLLANRIFEAAPFAPFFEPVAVRSAGC